MHFSKFGGKKHKILKMSHSHSRVDVITFIPTLFFCNLFENAMFYKFFPLLGSNWRDMTLKRYFPHFSTDSAQILSDSLRLMSKKVLHVSCR